MLILEQISEYFISLTDQISFYYYILKYFLYFCVGALFIFLIRKLVNFFQFFSNKFGKDFFMDRVKSFFNFIVFIVLSICIGGHSAMDQICV